MPPQETHGTHREVELLELLRSLGGSGRTSSLAEAMNVSEETVRRTVKALAGTGHVQRVHGGVYLTNSEAAMPVVSRLGKRSDVKMRIAGIAAKNIPDGSTVFLDVGSTTAYVADALRQHRDLTVVTNALNAATALVGVTGFKVFLSGGQLSAVEQGVFGADTMDHVARFNIDTAVLSIDGFDPRNGFLLAGSQEASLARFVSAHARRTIVVSDHTKFGQSAAMLACDPVDVDILITDKPLAPAFLKRIAGWEIEVIVAAEGEVA